MKGKARKARDAGLVERRTLLDERGVGDALARMAGEILARQSDPRALVLVGVRTGGVPLAQRLQKLVAARTEHAPALGVLDITLYRDDVFVGLPRPEVGPTELPGTLEGQVVVLVDDVLFTGRTTRAALVELMDYGRPRQVQLAVLVDRGWRELPIAPDYVGLAVETTREQTVRVHLRETGAPADRVVLLEQGP
ncbi:MAG TPA: bifunctional pyr operon transcriptional regulator/uracil phosphoribosyltransferase PyrR [Myxococcota bacterium]|nr:bifunctional pyr operon transcriptional regulator/uracil phosphoribosyltransferase PyrR [Myxococcota bacterium]